MLSGFNNFRANKYCTSLKFGNYSKSLSYSAFPKNFHISDAKMSFNNTIEKFNF